MKAIPFLVVVTLLTSQAIYSQNNTNVGDNAGQAGIFNVSVGDYSGNHIIGRNSVFVGYRSGSAVGNNGRGNTFVGSRSGLSNTRGDNNSFFGNLAGRSNITSSNNTFMGASAGFNNMGDMNTFIGSQSGFGNTLGNSNVFIGTSAGLNVTEGSDNIYIGNAACSNNTLGSQNCIFGTRAATEGNFNGSVIIGFEAALHNRLSYNNVIIGSGAVSQNELYSEGNTIIGAEAGYNLSAAAGGYNTFIGYRTGYSNAAGVFNIFIGSHSGYGNQDGSSNIFIGFNSGKNNLSNNNLFFGHGAGSNNVEGSSNIFLGNNAGANSEGNGNVFIGNEAGLNVVNSNRLYIANSGEGIPLIYGDFDLGNIALGAIDAGSYRLYVSGNVYTTGTWTSSDERFKEDQAEIADPLEKVRNLKGKTFYYSQAGEFVEREFNPGLNYGFIAQELKEVIPELVRDDPEGYLCINYDGIIPVLAEAIKEMDNQYNQQISALKTEIALLQLQLDQQQISASALTRDEDLFYSSSNKLYQNTPNPFNADTRVQYYLSDESRDASIFIYDLQGKLLLSYNDLKPGNGAVMVNAGELSPGMFNYCLISNGSIVDVKKLVVTE